MGDRERVYEDANMVGNVLTPGDSPALIVVDLQNGETDPNEPIGSDLSGVIERTNELVDICHEIDMPVIFTRVVYTRPDAVDGGLWPKQIPTLAEWTRGTYPTELDDRVHVHEDDHVLEKPHASSFHGTELASMLTAMGVDTLLVTGCSTGGCIRATVSDASAHGFVPIVPKSCVADRSEEQHDAHLWDIDAKFGDVVSTEETKAYLEDI